MQYQQIFFHFTLYFFFSYFLLFIFFYRLFFHLYFVTVLYLYHPILRIFLILNVKKYPYRHLTCDIYTIHRHTYAHEITKNKYLSPISILLDKILFISIIPINPKMKMMKILSTTKIYIIYYIVCLLSRLESVFRL